MQFSKLLCSSIAALLIGTLFVAPGSAQEAQAAGRPSSSEWRQWRGPRRSGHVPRDMVPRKWPQKLEVRWKYDIGTGHASPVVADGRVFTITRRGENEVVTAIVVETGKPIWEKDYRAEIGINPYAKGHGRWPRATPLVHDDRLITLGASATWSCFDAASGKQLWQFEREGGVETKDLFCGTSVSPLVHADVVIAHLGDDSGGEMIARKIDDGSESWRTKLEGPGYASPVVATLGGVKQLVTLTKSRVIGMRVENGELLWSFPFEDKWNENILTPVIHGDVVIVAGVRRGTFALRPKPPREGQEDWTAETVWSDRGMQLYMSSPVLHGDVLYAYSRKRRGSLIAVEAESGKTLWTHREPAENAALLHTGDHLLALTTGGEAILAKVDREKITELRRFRVADSPTWAHPVPLADGLIVKAETSIVRLGPGR